MEGVVEREDRRRGNGVERSACMVRIGKGDKGGSGEKSVGRK